MNPFFALPLILLMAQPIALWGKSLPKVGIKEVRFGGKTIYPPFDSIALKPTEDDLHIFFDDSSPIDSFEFQLLGFDKEPIISVYPFTRFTNLTGGEYIFVLTSIQNNKRSPAIELSIRVSPKAIEADWFIPSLVLYISLVVFGLAFLGVMYRYRQKMHVQNLRNKISMDLHEKVGSALSSITVFAKALKNNYGINDPEAIEYMDDIIEAADESNDILHDAVWSLNPDLDNAQELFEKIRAFASKIFSAKGIQFHVEIAKDEFEGFSMSMLQRRNVYFIAIEAVINIIKHSEAKNASISVKKEGRKIRLTIQDNGKGFDPDEPKIGNGLKNFKRRAKESFLVHEIQSRENEGTTISLLIPQL